MAGARAPAAPSRRPFAATRETAMDEEVFNIEIRKFLKEVGVTSQRVVEQAVRDAVKQGRLKGGETLAARMVLTVDALALEHRVDGTIKLG
jgi:hypothetical protein